MPPADVTDKHVLETRTCKIEKRSRVLLGKIKFKEGHLVRTSIEKMTLAEGSEHNCTVEIFKIIKFIGRTLRPVYELEFLNGTLIEAQFYGNELTPVRVTKHIVCK